MRRAKPKRRFSLRTWLALSFMLFSFIAAAILFLELIFFAPLYYTFKIRETRHMTEELMTAYDTEDFAGRMRTDAFSNQVCVTVTDDRGRVLYSEDVMGGNCLLHGWRNYLYPLLAELRASESGNITLSVFDEQLGMETLVVGSVIGDAAEPDGYILCNTIIEPIGTTVSLLKRVTLCIALVLLVVGLVIAMILSDRLSRPIIRITRSAGRMAQGDYTTVFQGGGYREADELARTLSYAEHEIARVDTMQRDLIANVSHDLRTPLTMLKAYAEMIRDLSGDNPVKRAAHLQVIIEETDRLTMLVTDILDLSKLENGSQKLETQTLEVSTWLGDIISRYKGISEQMGYHITFTPDEERTVTCDPGKLERVVCNLINNAINYTGEDKCVYVTQVNTDEGVRIEVRDTGAGIEEDKLSKIFDKYYRSENHKRETIGTGLGLSIVKAILKLHGFPYGVRSKLGEGSVFWFEIR